MPILQVPYQWQQKAVEQLLLRRRGIICAVPGAGKTLIGLMLLAEFYKNPAFKNCRSLVGCPTKALIKQWRTELDAALPQISPLVRLETFSFLSRHYNDFEVKYNIGVFIIDECHRSHSPKNKLMHGMPALIKVGMTATPKAECFTKFGKIVANVSWEQAHLSDFKLKFIGCELNSEERIKYKKFTEKIGALYSMRKRNPTKELDDIFLHVALLRRALVHTSKQKLATALSIVLAHPNKRMMIFGERISQIETVAKILAERGIKYAIMHSDKEEGFEDYMSGKVNILLSSRLLREGFNSPSTELGVVISYPLTSNTFVQTTGRIVRYFTGKHAEIYYIVAKDTSDEKIISEAIFSCGKDKVSLDYNYKIVDPLETIYKNGKQYYFDANNVWRYGITGSVMFMSFPKEAHTKLLQFSPIGGSFVMQDKQVLMKTAEGIREIHKFSLRPVLTPIFKK